MCNVWKIVLQIWSGSFVRHVPLHPPPFPISPHDSTPAMVTLGTPRLQLTAAPSRIQMDQEVNAPSALCQQALTPTQRIWTPYRSSRKRKAAAMTSSFPFQRQTQELQGPCQSSLRLRSAQLASTARVVYLHSPVGLSMKRAEPPLKITHAHTGRSFGPPLV
jgi:hypothetical protein